MNSMITLDCLYHDTVSGSFSEEMRFRFILDLSVETTDFQWCLRIPIFCPIDSFDRSVRRRAFLWCVNDSSCVIIRMNDR
jgi:hypothetical protein